MRDAAVTFELDAGANWAGNLRYSAARLLRPSSVPELQDLVGAGAHIRALGTRHSFNDLADTQGDLVDVRGLPAEVEIDEDARRAVVAAGMSYAEVAAVLDGAGWALPNLASLPHISIAGAIATATHGSGSRHGNLATVVRGIEVVGADGELRRLDDGDATFDGSVVALGGLGVLTRVELAIEASYQVEQRVWDGITFDAVLEDVPAAFDAGYSVSLFTDWTGAEFQQAWVKSRAGGGPAEAFLGGVAVREDRHPIRGLPPGAATTQGGRPGSWHERLPHFRPDLTPSAGQELQSEYLLPLHHAAAAIEVLRELDAQIAPIVLVSELRTVRADRLWLSMSYGEDALAVHFTWRPELDAVLALTARIEVALAPFGARPHWGKIHTVGADRLRELYPRYDDFAALVRVADPAGKFGNAALARWFPPTA